MLDKRDFSEIKKKIEKFDVSREALLRKSRDIIRLSKQIVYSVHRDEFKKAADLIKKIKKELEELYATANKNTELFYSGSFKVAVQEYTEAICFFNVIKNKKLPTSKEFGVNVDYYLLGLCDLTGELVRKAIKYAIKGDYDKVFLIRDFVEELYNDMLTMNLKNGELRKKVDGMNYDLKKLEELTLTIQFKK